MPAAVAIPLITAGVSGGAAIAGAKMSSGAARDAANASTAAANHAADVQGQSTRDALDFQKAEAQAYAQQAEIDRHANYDQTAARLQRLGSIGDLLGFHVNTQMPAYVPGVTPNFTGAPNGPSSPSGVGATGIMPYVGGTAGPGVAGPPSIGGAIDPAQIAALRQRMNGNTGVIPPAASAPLQFQSIGSYF